jgi:hypothetical protein
MKRTKPLLGLIVGLLAIAGICKAVQVDGYCYLENQSMHDGTKVLFSAVSPYAQTDSTYTNNVGHYQINLAQGVYDVHLTHFAYFEQQFLNQSFYSAITLPDVTLSYMGGIPLSGALSGVLEGITYIVVHDISVSNGDSLIISPGASLLFNSNINFYINSYLYAVGTVVDSIFFKPNEGVQSWGCIEFQSSCPDDSRMEYCRVSGASNSAIQIGGTSITISHCLINNNSADDGGGIFCQYTGTAPTIIECVISNNYSRDKGGGIFIWSTNPSIIDCIITGNSASGLGTSSGGGIYSFHGNPLIERCILSENYASQYGGGFGCYNSTAIIMNSTISRNHANLGGGGVSCSGDEFPLIQNTILWGDSITQGINEIYLLSGADVEVRYSDVQGGWTGVGNINRDPLFVDPPVDYHLTANSPCIDAGDPNSPRDPDGTRADMGAFFYDHYLPIITISTNLLNFGNVSIGEQTSRPLIIYNLGTAPLILYEISNTEPVFSTDYDPSDSLIQSGDSLQVMVYFAPEDTVQYEDFLSINNNHIPLDVRLVGVGIPPGGVREKSSSIIPKVYALFPAYPNPFNPLTTLSFSVPVSSMVTLNVYDITGRQVAILSNGWQAAGIHKVTFDGSELASGIYFCQMTAGKFNGVVKMVLLK